MKKLKLEINNIEYEAHISPDLYGCRFFLYRIVPKKHWWSFSKQFLDDGWIHDNIEQEIRFRIKKIVESEEWYKDLMEQYDNL